MNTTISTDGKATTTINATDRKALAKVTAMARHCQANVPELKEIGINVANGIAAMLKHFGEAPQG